MSLSPVSVLASACCGGAFSIPAVITGDDKAQVSTSFSHSRIHADVSPDGLWRKRKADDITEVFKIDAAHIFVDRWQAGFSLPIQSRTKEGRGTSSGLSDIAMQVGYEYLPEWEYHPIRPKGVGFLTAIVPTGTSLEESLATDGGLSARGRGFWAVGAGTVLTKIHKAWDLSATFEAHHSFPKTSHGNTLTPGLGSSAAFGIGWNTQWARIGGALAWTQEDPVKVSGDNISNGSLQRYATASVSASYIFPENWAGTVSYSDQTLFGNPSTTALSKGLVVLLQKRWNR